MAWLGLDADEGPYFQTQRFDRYREVIEQWLSEGKAYHCYCTREELDALRQRQMDAGDHVRYDGRCRERNEPREGVEPVVRFKNPLDGQVVVEDRVRGRVVFENAQLDDLIIARSDGTPTYNFSVIIDDFDMQITHVIRGDDHLNNTPRQMNMLRGPRCRAAGLRPFANDPGTGRRQALETARCGGHSRISGAGLSARGDVELPCSSWLVARRPGDCSRSTR